MKTLLLSLFALAAVAAVPTTTYAALYAYVNQQGEVRSVEAPTPTQAITTAPNIDEHSGVMLLDSSADMDMVGDTVPGV